MEQVRSTDWMRHVPKILKAGAVLAIISIFLPANHNFQSSMGISLMEFMWYFGLYFGSISGGGYSETHTDFITIDGVLTVGIIAIVLLIIAFILMVIAANKARYGTDNKIAAATGLIGGILALIGIAEYYFGLKQEIPGFWTIADPGFGFYLPIIGGILGIIGGVAAGYSFSLESKGELTQKIPYQPTQDKMVSDKGSEVTDQQEKPVFCKNCGTKLVGEFCQECGQKAEF
jgi:hypothetical protein